MQNYEIISNEYYSNCLIEAIKAKLKNHKVKIYFCKPRIMKNGHFQMCHFMWSDGIGDYDFSDFEENELPFYRDLIFKGAIRKFELGFAEKYSKYRNRKRGKENIDLSDIHRILKGEYEIEERKNESEAENNA